MTWWYRRLVFSIPAKLRVPVMTTGSIGLAFVVYKSLKAATAPAKPHTMDKDYVAAMEEVRKQQFGNPIRHYKGASAAHK